MVRCFSHSDLSIDPYAYVAVLHNVLCMLLWSSHSVTILEATQWNQGR